MFESFTVFFANPNQNYELKLSTHIRKNNPRNSTAFCKLKPDEQISPLCDGYSSCFSLHISYLHIFARSPGGKRCVEERESHKRILSIP
ncbi:unnamed protein product [Larinioides sclopetarius]|uniref:Uncharacterized protein n=1 Tax=Larinioides sclopetarius TaxID=280406 RepID=A0AAV2BBK2_9ARAC